MFFEAGVVDVGDREIALRIVVQAGYGAHVADYMQYNLVCQKGTDEGNPDPAEIVLDVYVFEICGSGGLVTAVGAAAGRAMATTSSRTGWFGGTVGWCTGVI